MKRKTSFFEKKETQLLESISENEGIVIHEIPETTSDEILASINKNDNSTASSIVYRTLIYLKQKVRINKKDDPDVIRILNLLNEIVLPNFQYFYNETIVSYLYSMLSIEFSTFQNSIQVSNFAIKMLSLFAYSMSPEHLINIFLKSQSSWILNERCAELCRILSAIFNTKFPSKDACSVIDETKINISGICSPYEHIFDCWIEHDVSFNQTDMENHIKESPFFKKLQDNQNDQLNEQTIATEILTATICCGSQSIRAIITDKITEWLKSARAVKLVIQFIVTLIQNINLTESKSDLNTLLFLIGLKLKLSIENLINYFLKIYLINNPSTLCPFLTVLVCLEKDKKPQLFLRAVHLIRSALEISHSVIIPQLVSFWSIGMDDLKRRVFISSVFRCKKITFHIVSYFYSLFNQNISENELKIFFKNSSETIGCCLLDCFIDAAHLQKTLPCYSSAYDFKKLFIMDENVSKYLYECQLLYLTFFARYLSMITKNNPLSHEIFSAFCTGASNVLMLSPIEAYIPAFERLNIDISDYQFVKNQMTNQCLLNKYRIVDNLLDLFHSFSFCFVDERLRVTCLEFFSTIFDIFLKSLSSLKPHIDSFINSLLQKNILDRLWEIASVKNNKLRSINKITFTILQKVYLKLFFLSPQIIGQVIFENFITIKYIFFYLCFPIDLSEFLKFESFASPRQQSEIYELTPIDSEILNLDLKINIPLISNSLIDLEELGKIYDLRSILLCDSTFFMEYLKKLWIFCAKKSTNEPRESLSVFSFIPNLVKDEENCLSNLPPIVLIVYFCMKFFKMTFLSISLHRQVIQALFAFDFDELIIQILFLGFSSRLLSVPCLIIFLILTSKNTQATYFDDDFLNDFIIDSKYTRYFDVLNKAAENAFSLELENRLFLVSLKIFKILSSPGKFSFLMKWVENKTKIVQSLFQASSQAYALFISILTSDLSQTLSPDQLFYLYFVLSLSPLNKNFFLVDYSRLLSFCENALPNFKFSIKFLKNESTANIVYSNENSLVESFLDRFITSKLTFQTFECFFELLTQSKFLPNAFIKVSQKILFLIQTVPEMKIREKVSQRLIEILSLFPKSMCNFIPELLTFLQIESPKSNESISSPSLFIAKINIDNDLTKYFHEKPQRLNSLKQPSSQIKIKLSSPNFEKSQYFDIKKLTSKDYVDLVKEFSFDKFIQLFSLNDINIILDDLTNLNESVIYPISGKVLDVFTSFYLHPQLFYSKREAPKTYSEICRNLPKKSNLLNLIASCLIHEHLNKIADFCDFQTRKLLWTHIIKGLKVFKIESLVSSVFPKKCGSIFEYPPQIQSLVLFVHLNNPEIYHNLIYQSHEFLKFSEMSVQITSTLTDQILMKIFSSFTQVFKKDSDYRSCYRLMIFCQIFRLYPLLITRFLNLILSNLSIVLKARSCTFLNESNSEELVSSFDSESFSILIHILVKLGELVPFNELVQLQINKLHDYINLITSKYNINPIVFKSFNIDAIISILESSQSFIFTNISCFEVAFWILTIPINQITTLYSYISELGNRIYFHYIRSNNPNEFVSNIFPLIAILPLKYKKMIMIDLISKGTFNENSLKISNSGKPTFNLLFEDYFQLFWISI